ncbi:MAG: cation transporter [Streptococcaceae bacterium]|jgi:di/tricarboxylate transporter|nr:cation transporter [Streptococcaceae bacterium]
MEQQLLHQPSPQSPLRRFFEWFIRDKVFLVSFILAMLFVIFGRAHFTTRFFDYKVIFTVFGIMLVIEGFRSTGLLTFLGETLVKRSANTRQLVRFTTNLTFFLAIFFTNDLTILTVLPLYMLITRHIENRRSVYLGAAFILPACHLGSSLFPFGNPHNLYLYSFYHIPTLHFMMATGLLWFSGLVVLNLAIFLIDKEPIKVKTEVQEFKKRRTIIFVALLLVMALSVFNAFPYIWATAFVVVVIAIYRPKCFRHVDYHLLLTFICFFLIVGNIVDITWITHTIHAVANGVQSTFLSTVVVSQFISNISSSVLISPFTTHGISVVLGADVGGIGTFFASMATLIAYKVIRMQSHHEAAGFVKYFLLSNACFLVVMTLVGLVIVTII